MDKEWKQFTQALKTKLPIYHSRLKPGASAQAIHALETKIGSKLPPEFTTLYLINNGENEEWFIGGAMLGMKMLTLAEIEKEWKTMAEVEDKYHFNKKWSGDIIPKDAVRIASFSKGWIPVFSDLNGNYIGIDLDPATAGTRGQVINFGTDEYSHYVFANSLTDFIKLINTQFKNGVVDKAIFKNDKGQNVAFGLVEESHLIDDLKALKK